MKTHRPYLGLHCDDCAVGTNALGEDYMVHDHVWEQAWAGRRKPWHEYPHGHEILCIGCLERRLGRTLTRHDFTDAPCNHPDHQYWRERSHLEPWPQSGRLRDRLSRGQSSGAVIRFPTRNAAAVFVTPAIDGGWLVLARDHGWLHDDTGAAMSDARWLATNLSLPVRRAGQDT